MKMLVRMFFRILRIAVGPVMLFWEYVSQPKGVLRDPDSKSDVDQQCRGLALYQYRTCPFCIKVRKEIRRLSLTIKSCDAQAHESHRDELVSGGGQAKVPCLRITDSEGNHQWMYESAEIIAYLRGRFAA